MKKSDKKIHNQLCKELTVACEIAKSKVTGFQCLSHRVNYKQFPDSLSIICTFNTRSSLTEAKQNDDDQLISDLIHQSLKNIDIHFKKNNADISFISKNN